jgi:hypothetical protein
VTADDATRELRPSGSPADHGTTQHYEIRVQGHLGAHWAAWFDGLSLSREEDGTTAIRGPVADQAALHGVLRTLCDVGLPLISLTPIPDDAPAAPRADGSKGT